RNTFEPLMLTDWTYGQVVWSVCTGILHAYAGYLVCYSITALAVASWFGPSEFALTLTYVPVTWLTVLWLGVCAFESSRGETSILRSLFATAVLGGASLGTMGYFWFMLLGAGVLSVARARGASTTPVPALIVGVIACGAMVLVMAASYVGARQYFRRLEWKAHRPPQYAKAVKAALRGRGIG